MRAYALQQSPDNCRSFNPGARVVSRAAKCLNGKAGEYPCSGVDLLDMITHSELQSNPAVGGGEGSDVWGWEYNGREFGIITQTDSTAFVEIDIATGAMRYLGRLNTQTTSALWRDAKTIGNYVYIGSEAANHGIQVFDLRRLLNVSTPEALTLTKVG